MVSDRELEVLNLIAHGQTTREIAERLYISENTVRSHVRNILEKLGLHSRLDAAAFVIRESLLDPYQ